MKKQSSMDLVFGRCDQWFKNDSGYVEKKNEIYKYLESYETLNLGKARFWRYVTSRLHQKDDFTFPSLAAVTFLPGAHCYRIFFNPLRFWVFYLMSKWLHPLLEANYNIDPDDIKSLKESESKIELASKIFQNGLIQSACKGENWTDNEELKDAFEKSKTILKEIGLDSDITKIKGFDEKLGIELFHSFENRQWTESGWKEWNHYLHSNKEFYNNVASAMIHECLHVLWSHLTESRRKEKPVIWNIAGDYAINQHLHFDEYVSTQIITKKSKIWFREFICALAWYLGKNDESVRNKLKGIGLNWEKAKEEKGKWFRLFANISNAIDLEGERDYNNKYTHKTADFYYNILINNPFIDENGGNGSGKTIDDHESWQQSENGEPNEGTPNEGGDGDNKQKSDILDGEEKANGSGGTCDKKGKESEEGEENGKPNNSHGKSRGDMEGGIEHDGFQGWESSARREIKDTVGRGLKAAGYDPKNPRDLEKALNDIGGLGVMGSQFLDWFKVQTHDWKKELNAFISRTKTPTSFEPTMRREHRVLRDVFPGRERLLGLDVILAPDTSGSVSGEDWNDFVNQVLKITKDCDVQKCRVIQWHSRISDDRMVDIRKFDKMSIKETGGTHMSVVLEKLKREKNRKPVIIFTDGGVEQSDASQWDFPIIVFISRGNENMVDYVQKMGYHVVFMGWEN